MGSWSAAVIGVKSMVSFMAQRISRRRSCSETHTLAAAKLFSGLDDTHLYMERHAGLFMTAGEVVSTNDDRLDPVAIRVGHKGGEVVRPVFRMKPRAPLSVPPFPRDASGASSTASRDGAEKAT